MSIHVCHDPTDDYAGQVVAAGLARSFSAAQVTVGRCCGHSLRDATVWINPAADAANQIADVLDAGGKAIVLGKLGDEVAEVLALELHSPQMMSSEWADCGQDTTLHHDESRTLVRYRATHPVARYSPLKERPLCRFDFANEWNNLGFGRITLDGSPWSVASAVEIGDASLIAELVTPDRRRLVYAALRENENGAVLWFNRSVGPVDSQEWRVIESFLGDYRAFELPCYPYLSEIPANYASAVCARLDCDEAIGSARDLWTLYEQQGLPLSLAVVTGHAVEEDDQRLLLDCLARGGSVVSHSVRHAPNWGGSYELACVEARDSSAWLAEQFAAPARFAVSPFHQNPTYAVTALADCDYEGFVAGIIANDPEYLIGRAGRVPFAPRPLVSHSAQCMLHGDCYRRYGHSIDTYRQSYEVHRAGRSIFGYLDHPFSERYRYGWQDEPERIAAHRELIEHIGCDDDVWWASVSEVLDFLRTRDAVSVAVDDNGGLQVAGADQPGRRTLAVLWKGGQVDY